MHTRPEDVSLHSYCITESPNEGWKLMLASSQVTPEVRRVWWTTLVFTFKAFSQRETFLASHLDSETSSQK